MKALFTFLLLFTVHTGARTFCATDKPWSCLGSIEVATQAGERTGSIRLDVHGNGDEFDKELLEKLGRNDLTMRWIVGRSM